MPLSSGRSLLAMFPKAALGASVIFAALKLIELPEFLRLQRFRRSELALALSTTVFQDFWQRNPD